MKDFKDMNYVGYMINEVGDVLNCLSGRILKQCNDKKGYQLVNLMVQGKNKSRRVHRLVGETFLSNPENKPQINHKDNNKKNNHISNLEWATNRENIDHSIRNNYHKTKLAQETRSKNGKANRKLTMADAKIIRNIKKNNKIYNRELAETFNVNRKTIDRIIKYKTYKEYT